MRTFARGIGYLAAVLPLPLLFWGCERAEGPARLAIGVHAEPGVLLPVLAAGDVGAEVSGMLHLGLNSAVWRDGALDYRLDDRSLAEAWEFSADSLVLTYTLRPSIVWSDGHPIDADDVVFTYELLAREEISSPLAGVWEHLDSVVAKAPDRVSFYFEERYPGQLFDTGVGIIPQHVFRDVASDHATLATHRSLSVAPQELVVSGPYRLAAWDRGERLVLEPNPAYRGAPPRIERVFLRLIQDETVRRAELENGSIDVARAISPSRAGDFAADAGFQVASSKGRFYDFIAWNGDRVAAFGDPLVRRALSLAIDRRSILGGLEMGDYARPAGGPYPDVFERLADPEVQPDPFLPDSAMALLASQGWRDSNGDGVLERNGQALRFTLLTQSANQRREYAAQAIQAHLARVGVDMDVELLEFNTLLAVVFERRDFDAVLMGWGVGLQPDYIVGRFWPAQDMFNITRYTSPALDSLIPLALSAPTAERAAPYWRSAARQIASDRPYAFLWFFDELVVLNERVKNYRIDTYGVFQNLHRWTVAPR